MRRMAMIGAALAVVLGAMSGGAARAEPPARAQALAAKGLAAAQAADFPGYASLCDLEARIRNVNLPRSARSGGSKRSGRTRPPADPVAPTQVFDNLYFLGTPGVTAWLYGTPEGYILIDALNTDEEAQEIILGGMAQLGLDPAAIRYLLITHGHGDHYGGADYLAEALGVPVLMTEADWDLVAQIGTHPRFGPPPARDRVIRDGDVLEFGRSRLRIVATPGHTPGTVSPLFEVFDHGRAHMAMIWGGTGFNFGPDPAMFRIYAQSAERAREIAQEAGVGVYLSGHPRRDGTLARLAALETRPEGRAHPFLRGPGGAGLFTVLAHCAEAQALRVAAEAE